MTTEQISQSNLLPNLQRDNDRICLTHTDVEVIRKHLVDTIFVMVGSPYEDIGAIIARTRLLLNELEA